MIAVFLTALLILAPSQAMNQVSDAQKQEFLELLKRLPTQGEFYTDEAVKTAGPYLPVLFALTEKEIEKHHIYPFIALSRALCDQSEQRDYAVLHFANIKHPHLKLFWGSVLFDSGAASDEIEQFLRKALASKDQERILSEMLGPKFESFKKRVLLN